MRRPPLEPKPPVGDVRPTEPWPPLPPLLKAGVLKAFPGYVFETVTSFGEVE